MQIPKLTGIEFLIEEGRLPGLLFSFAAFLATIALIFSMMAFPEVRVELAGNLTTLTGVLAGAGGVVSAFKTWVKSKNGNGNGNGNANGHSAPIATSTVSTNAQN